MLKRSNKIIFKYNIILILYDTHKITDISILYYEKYIFEVIQINNLILIVN